ncbi:MAG: hypothetical protein AAB089_03965, partial [Nitrospirota bacterium]
MRRQLSYKTLIYFLPFIFVFSGIQLPISDYLPTPIKKLISVVNQVTEIKEAQAAVSGTTSIKTVYRGTASFAVEEGARVVSIGGTVDISKSIILISTRATYNSPGESLFAADFEDASNISIQRGLASDTTGTEATVAWQVIEFNDGVNVIRGQTTFPAGTSETYQEKVITLPVSSTSITKTFPIITGRNETAFINLGTANGRAMAAQNDECWDVTVVLGGANNNVLTLRREDNYADQSSKIKYVPLTVFYQVIEFATDVVVQSSTTTITAGNASATAAITSVNTSKALLFFSSRASLDLGGIEAYYMTSGRFSAANQLTFERGGTTGSVVVAWYVVEFTDGTAVLSGNPTGITGASSTTAAACTANRSFGLASVSMTATGTDINALDDASFTHVIDGTNIVSTRVATGASVRAPYLVCQFPTVKLVAPNGGDTLLVGDTYDITWRASSGVSNVKLEYSDDNGGTWKTIIASVAVSPTTYTWTVGKDSIGADILPTLEKEIDCLVRVSNAADATQNDVSNAALTIKSKLSVTAPNGGELWYVGDTTRSINWSKWGNFGTTVKLQYSIDAPHAVWTDITGATALLATAGSFAWNPVPLAAAGATAQTRVISNTNVDILDASNANFEIRGNIAL